MSPAFHSGFVSIAGRPNAGKSTLLNALVGGKLAIVSEKPQTTRTAVEGVVNLENAQIVFLDTPGIHASGSLLNRRMMDTVRSSLADRDLLLYLNDSTARFTQEDVQALEVLRDISTPAFLLLTKMDKLADKRLLLPRIEEIKAVREFDEYLPISAKTGEGLDRLRDAILQKLPEGPAYFPPDYLTDQPERFLAGQRARADPYPRPGGQAEALAGRDRPAALEQRADRRRLVGHRHPDREAGPPGGRHAAGGQRVEQPAAALGVQVRGAGEQPPDGAVVPQRGDGLLQQVTHPSGAERLPAFHARHRDRVPGQYREPKVGA